MPAPAGDDADPPKEGASESGPGWGASSGADDPQGDREEQRERYQELLQELRVILPGVEVLAGFLFTVPFANGFDRLDEVGRVGFAVSLVSAVAATVAFLTPTAFHRVAERSDRAARVRIGVRMAVVGLVFVALALASAMFVVTRLIYGSAVAAAVTGALAAAMVGAWWVLPSRYRHHERAAE